MAVQQQKIRIYDLAKELKLDNKRVIDDARREGIDVSVPSNSVPMDVAERIRTKYFPKKVTPAAAGPRLVKHVKKAEPEAAAEPAVELETAPYEGEQAPADSEQPLTPAQQEPEPARPKVRILKPAPAPKPGDQTAAQPDAATAEAAAMSETEESMPEPAATIPGVPIPPSSPRPRTQVRVLRPQPGMPAHAPGAVGTAPQVGRAGVRASGAEAPATLEAPARKMTTTYVPQDTGRPRKRTRRGKRGHEGGPEEGKHVEVPRHMRGPGTVIQQRTRPVFTELRPIKLIEGTTLKDFSEKLEVKAKDVVQMLLQRGVMATINQTLNQDIAQEIGKEFGYDISFVNFEEMISETEEEKIIESGEEGLIPRAPVVTVMGHVDHGKTSLLDAIRETRVAEGEAGGITQHIGAYSVEVADPDQSERKRRIVFLDTPGHEAFTMMRARGARVTDIVVLVVAADDGVMPQTIEAIDHARAAEVPIIVAINKIDKPEAQPDRVKQGLSDRGLLWDGWGGDTVMVEVSAKNHQNLDALLEMIILTTDLLELKGNPDRLASGVVLEAKLDRGRGAVGTVLVQQGTIKVGDPFIAGQVFGRVRAMFDDRGHSIERVGPSTPVEVLGLQGVPHAGDQLQVVQDATQAQHIANQRQMQARLAAIARTSARGLEQLFADKSQIKELLVILKGDVQGSVEAVRDALNKLSTERVKIRIIRSGVGAITESDVMLAAASSKDMNRASAIIGFNVRPETRAREIAEVEDVDIRLHTVIYKIEEEIRAAMLGLLEATKREVIAGHAEIRQVFRVPKVGQVAGCYVIDGTVRRTTARILRDNVVVYEGRIDTLKRFKEDVSEVRQGFECGISLERFQDVKVGDVIEAYTTEEVAPTSL
ncbi:MAG TPA: translation initiation factor IF-2 [Blastocatellia bacterium]|jgi:translation initiation factor IF-2|nr:translation initiation factor IF-2 [Blastocatellia bacterium]